MLSLSLRNVVVHTLPLIALIAGAGMLPAQTTEAAAAEWPAYGRDRGGARHSPLTGITPANVAQLEVAWIHRTGDDMPAHGRFQSTPIMVDGTLYVTTPLGRVNALDPATGRELWTFDPGVRLDAGYGDFANRGVSTWLDPDRSPDEPCSRRIFVAPIDARLIALDARTGAKCADFGDNGTVVLGRELDLPVAYPSEYQVTSPPAVLRDLVVVGSAIADNQRTDAASGVVRAYDARTGSLRWTFDPVPRSPRDSVWGTWSDSRGRHNGDRTGAANVWSVIATDSVNDLVFLPTSSPSPDFYGGERLGTNSYANSLVALRGTTGDVAWYRQLVHHDIWDYDIASPPALFTMRRNGEEIPAVAQATKMGMVFVFDRRTGQPLHAIEERPVPASDVPGEQAWPTQPFPVLPAPFIRHSITPDDAFGVTDAERAQCRARIESMRHGDIYTPPSLQGTVVFPGNLGGSNWGGVAVDETRGIIVGAANELPFAITLIPRDSMDRVTRGSGELSPQRGTPYGMLRSVMLSPSGVPCITPPFGTLTAVDAASGETRWQVPLGWLPQLVEALPDAKEWGSVNLGGPITTASGLVFIAATLDAHLRALDVETGKELWAAPLPTAGLSTPMTYEADGRQFVVVAAGGHDRLLSLTDTGDWLVAFALPENGAAPTPRPLPTAVSFAGDWAGDLRLGDSRYPATLTLMPAAGPDSIAGTLVGRGDGFEFAGELRGVVVQGVLTWHVPFSERNTGCSGTLDGTVELANEGAMLSSRLSVTSNCGDGGTHAGAFGLRRQGGAP